MTTTVGRLAVAAVGVRIVRLLIRTVGFAATIRILSVVPVRPGPTDPRLPAEIAAVGRLPYSASCLDRSVYLWAVLHVRGVEGHIRLGIERTAAGIEGHAWVEVDGRPVNERPEVVARYAVFEGDPATVVFT